MIRRPPRSTQSRSSAASDVYKRQLLFCVAGFFLVLSQPPFSSPSSCCTEPEQTSDFHTCSACPMFYSICLRNLSSHPTLFAYHRGSSPYAQPRCAQRTLGLGLGLGLGLLGIYVYIYVPASLLIWYGYPPKPTFGRDLECHVSSRVDVDTSGAVVVCR